MTPGQAAYLAKATDSTAAARVLLAEGFPDYAAGRAYYAMFHAVTVLLDHHGRTFKKHSTLLSAFSKLLHETEVLPRECHRWIADAYNARTASDYRAERPISSDEASVHIANADRMIELVSRVVSTRTPEQ